MTSRSRPSSESGPAFAASELIQEPPLAVGVEPAGAARCLEGPDLANDPQALVDVGDDLGVVRRDLRAEPLDALVRAHTVTAAISAAPLNTAWRIIGG